MKIRLSELKQLVNKQVSAALNEMIDPLGEVELRRIAMEWKESKKKLDMLHEVMAGVFSQEKSLAGEVGKLEKMMEKKLKEIDRNTFEFEQVFAAITKEDKYKRIEPAYKEHLLELMGKVPAQLSQAAQAGIDAEIERKKAEKKDVFQMGLKEQGVLAAASSTLKNLFLRVKNFLFKANEFNHSVEQVKALTAITRI